MNQVTSATLETLETLATFYIHMKNTQPIRLALLTDVLEDLQAGAEKQIYQLISHLDPSRYRVFVLSLNPICESTQQLMREAGCEFQVFRVVRIYGISGMVQGLRFMRFLKANRIQILQTYHFGSDIWGTFWAHWAGVRHIVSNRRDMGFCRKPIHRSAYKLINRWVHTFIAVAGAVKERMMKEEGIPAERIEVIYNGVESPIKWGHTPFPSSGEMGCDPISLIVHVANLRPVKGHIYLIEALPEIVVDHPRVRLALIGEDKMGGKLQEIIRKKRLERHVLFLGKREDVSRFIEAADICVLPSLSEGTSNAILEYMAAGKAVVATRVGGNPELIREGVDGLLVAPGDSRALKEALLTLIEDPEKRQSMGQNARQRAQKEFTIPQMMREYENFYQALLIKKVLHFISSGGFFGAERVALSLARHLNHGKFIPMIGAIEDERNPHLEIVHKAREAGLKTALFKSRGRWDWRTSRLLKKFIRQNRIDIVHTHNYKSDLMGLLATAGNGVPLLATVHGYTKMSRPVRWYEKLDRWLLKAFFRRVVVVAENILPDLKAQKRQVIPNGLDVNRFSYDPVLRKTARSRYGISDEEAVIGTVGRLSREKNQAMLIEAADQIQKEFPLVKFLIVGDGPEETYLKALVRDKNLEKHILFTGLIDDISSLYPALDIFVLTSLTEGVPLSLLEAMACARLVVATKVGGIPQIIWHGKNGFLVAPGDVTGLVKVLGRVVKDRSLFLEMGREASDFIRKHYSLEHMVEKYERLYEEI